MPTIICRFKGSCRKQCLKHVFYFTSQRISNTSINIILVHRIEGH